MSGILEEDREDERDRGAPLVPESEEEFGFFAISTIFWKIRFSAETKFDDDGNYIILPLLI